MQLDFLFESMDLTNHEQKEGRKFGKKNHLYKGKKKDKKGGVKEEKRKAGKRGGQEWRNRDKECS